MSRVPRSPECVAWAPVPLEEAENVRFMLFREANGLAEHVAILIGERDAWPDPVPVRLHSACLTGDLFGSLRCDCGEQLRRSLQMFSELIPAIKKEGLTVAAAVSVAFGCPFEGRVDPQRVADISRELISFGADFLMLGDTIGVGTPNQVKEVLELVGKHIDISKVGLHLHDTQATALANVLAGLEMGVTCFDSAVGGLGGCPYAPGASGNLPTENLVYMLEGMGIETGVNLEKLLEVGLWIQDVVGHPLASNGLRAYKGRKAAKEKASGAAG